MPHSAAIRPLVLGLLVLCAPVALGDYNCAAKRSLSKEMDVSDVAQIEILAVAGELDVIGEPARGRVVAEGRACTQLRFEPQLKDIDIIEERDGNTLRIVASVPRRNGRDSLIGALNMTIRVPDNLPINIVDTSGDIEVRGTGSITLRDSSGDVRLRDIQGDVVIGRDSSGDLLIRNAGNVRIDIDSSGDLVVREALSLTIGKDSSGDIRAVQIAGDVRVGKDSSGDITAVDVGGNLEVISDSSGDIISRNVAGSVTIPRNKRKD